MSPYLAALSLFVVILLAPSSAHACSCIAPGSPTVERDQADAVFAGRVRKVTRLDYRYAVEIDVAKSWKGDVAEREIIWTALDSAACGYYFEKDASYLIYAYVSEGDGLSTNICSRTKTLDDADEDLNALGAGEAFFSSSPRCGGPDNIAAMQGLFLVVLACPLIRRRRYNSIT